MLLLIVGKEGIIVVIVPMGSYVDVKVAHIEIDERHSHGMLVIREGIGFVAGSEEVNLVIAINI